MAKIGALSPVMGGALTYTLTVTSNEPISSKEDSSCALRPTACQLRGKAILKRLVAENRRDEL